MEGKIFSQGTELIKYLYNKNDQSYYLCKCTNCGNRFRQDGYSTRIGRQGCVYCRKRKDWCDEIRNEPIEVGDITRQWWAKRILSVLKHRRKKTPEFEYDLDMQYAWSLFLKQKKACIYTQIALKFPEEGFIGGTASLDRIDSSKGYIKGNVQWVHTRINNMKGDMTHDEFIDFCKKVTKNGK